MATPPPKDVTQMLVDWQNGDREAMGRLMPLLYDELHRLAQGYLRRERPGHTLQATALVNEAYLRMVDQTRMRWQNRAQFVGLAAQMMRRILVDHARSHLYAKRGGGQPRLSLDEAMGLAAKTPDLDLVALDDALNRLAEVDPEQSRIVELRFFGGLTIEETAEALGISPATVKREWSTAKVWLLRELTKE